MFEFCVLLIVLGCGVTVIALFRDWFVDGVLDMSVNSVVYDI